MSFTFLPHTADIKIRASGNSLSNAFEEVAVAIASFLAKDQKIKKTTTQKISIKGTDTKNLLYLFIEEIIFLLDAKNFILAQAEVSIKKNSLTAELKGDSSLKYKGLDHIKAPTYAEMSISRTSKSFVIQTVVDV